MSEAWIGLYGALGGAIIGGAFTLGAVVVNAHLTRRQEAERAKVERLDKGRILVTYGAIRWDEVDQCHIIPRWGIISLGDDHHAIAKRRRGRVGFICKEISPMSAVVPNYVVLEAVPI